MLVITLLLSALGLGQAQALGDVEEDVDGAVDTAKKLLARTKSEDRDIGQGVDALVDIGRKGSVDQEAADRILVACVHGLVATFFRRGTRAVLVDLVVLTVIGESTRTGVKGVAGVPAGGEVNTLRVTERVGASNSVLGQTRVLVGADGTALVTVVLLFLEVNSVDSTSDIETVAVVSSDNDKCVFERTELLELLNGGADSVVKLKELTEGAVVVKSVHLLVNAGGLGHQEPTLVATTAVEDVNSLESHVLEAGQILGVTTGSIGVVGLLLEVRLVDVAVEPGGQVGNGEKAKGAVLVGGGFKRGLVQTEAVALFGEQLIVVARGILAGEEVLGASTEQNIRAIEISPGVVSDAIKEGADNVVIFTAKTGVGSKSTGGGISKESSRDDTNTSVGVLAAEDLRNKLELGVIKGILGGVRIDTEGVDSGFVASVQSSGGVGRVGDERVHGVGHLVAEYREFVHLQLGLVLSIDALVCNQTSSSDHVGGHSVADEEDDVLSATLLGNVADKPVRNGLLLAVVGQDSLILAWFVERKVSVGLGGNVDKGGIFSILSE